MLEIILSNQFKKTLKLKNNFCFVVTTTKAT